LAVISYKYLEYLINKHFFSKSNYVVFILGWIQSFWRRFYDTTSRKGCERRKGNYSCFYLYMPRIQSLIKEKWTTQNQLNSSQINVKQKRTYSIFFFLF